jgi:hypothetical protein
MRTLLCLLLPLVAACSSTRVDVDHDPDHDFSGERTYAWKQGVPAVNELQQKRIVAGVDGELGSRGFQLVESGQPDLWVRTQVGGRQETRSTGSDVSFGVGRSVGFGHVGVGTSTGNRIYEVTVGTLVIELLDGGSEQVVWRAQAEDTVSSDAEKTAEAIREAIEDAFEGFPPGSGK